VIEDKRKAEEMER